jgi:hypothetical protein
MLPSADIPLTYVSGLPSPVKVPWAAIPLAVATIIAAAFQFKIASFIKSLFRAVIPTGVGLDASFRPGGGKNLSSGLIPV